MTSPTRADRWTSKRTVVLLGLLAAAHVAVTAAQTWGDGKVATHVVGLQSVSGTGGQLAPIVPGLALVGGAAAVAAATTGRVARRVAVVAMALAGLGVVGFTLALLTGLDRALGERAANLAASSEPIPMTGTATFWPWLAVAGGVLLALDAGLAAAGLRRWAGPTRRYERAGTAEPRERSLWERVGDEDDSV